MFYVTELLNLASRIDCCLLLQSLEKSTICCSCFLPQSWNNSSILKLAQGVKEKLFVCECTNIKWSSDQTQLFYINYKVLRTKFWFVFTYLSLISLHVYITVPINNVLIVPLNFYQLSVAILKSAETTSQLLDPTSVGFVCIDYKNHQTSLEGLKVQK